MNKTEICVPIRNEAELQKAREILERNGERIDKRFFKLLKQKKSYLICDSLDKDWFLTFKESMFLNKRTEIPLSELEAILRGENMDSSNVDSLIEEIDSLRHDIEIGVENDVIKISVRLIQIKEQVLKLIKND